MEDNKYKEYIELVDDCSSFGRWYCKICEILKQRNVPSTRLPDRAHFMSRVLASLDEAKLEKWLIKYSELESIDLDQLEEDRLEEDEAE
jgi:hypothetical protein